MQKKKKKDEDAKKVKVISEKKNFTLGKKL